MNTFLWTVHSPFFFYRWVLYEKPNFKGEKIALDEGDIELTNPFNPPEEQMENGQKDGEEQNGETNEEQTETKPARRFIIGSVRRAVRVREAQFILLLWVVVKCSCVLIKILVGQIQCINIMMWYSDCFFTQWHHLVLKISVSTCCHDLQKVVKW